MIYPMDPKFCFNPPKMKRKTDRKPWIAKMLILIYSSILADNELKKRPIRFNL